MRTHDETETARCCRKEGEEANKPMTAFTRTGTNSCSWVLLRVEISCPYSPFGCRRSPHAILADAIYIPIPLGPFPVRPRLRYPSRWSLIVLIYIYIHIYARRLILTLCVNTKFDLLGLGSPKVNEKVFLTVPVSLGLLLQVSH
jgi:hypothetical protein